MSQEDATSTAPHFGTMTFKSEQVNATNTPDLPPYSPSLVASSSAEKPPVPPSNYQYVVSNTGIKGSYAVDPDLEVPNDLLTAETRRDKSLYLEAKGGGIEADIWIVKNPEALGVSPRAVVDIMAPSTILFHWHRINLVSAPSACQSP